VLFKSEEKREKTHFTSVNMSTTTQASKVNFVPIESIIAFVFIGVVVLVGLIARCLALNHSTIRSAQSSDLMIYKPAPQAISGQRGIRPSTELSDSRDQRTSSEYAVTPTRVQRGPKIL
jgi:hypothetical protein